MRVSWMKVLGMSAAGLLLAGCNADLKDQNALLTEENEDLRLQLSDRNGALAEAQQGIRDKSMQLAQLRRDMGDLDRAPAQATGFESIPYVSAAYGAGEVTVTVQSDVLFAAGKTTLKSAAKRSLDAVASVLNRGYAGQPIRIVGHTDADPIRKSGHKSNYHLGFARAYAVRDYLTSKGVSGKRISLASFGPNQPRSTKAQSRRVEIAVVAD
ncbi:MAG: OmpA family protein [Planctomycetes bacterium]|nr:OmpA family protein [Planctomycetota bacterium]